MGDLIYSYFIVFFIGFICGMIQKKENKKKVNKNDEFYY